jgi:hypothetical protein
VDDVSFNAFYEWAYGRGEETMLISLRRLSSFGDNFTETVIMMAIYLSNTEYIHPTYREVVRFEGLAKYYLTDSWQGLVHPSSFVYIVNYLSVNDTLSNYIWINPYCRAWGIYNCLLSNLDDYVNVADMITGYKWKDTGPLNYILNEILRYINVESVKSYMSSAISDHIKCNKIPKSISKADDIMVQRFVPHVNISVFKRAYVNQLKT